MTNPPPYPSTGDGSGTPRWVKVSAIIALAVVLLFVVALLAGGHSPARHGGGQILPQLIAATRW